MFALEGANIGLQLGGQATDFVLLVVNDKGANPLLDFAGFYGHATTATMFLYAALSVAAIGFAQLLYRARLART